MTTLNSSTEAPQASNRHEAVIQEIEEKLRGAKAVDILLGLIASGHNVTVNGESVQETIAREMQRSGDLDHTWPGPEDEVSRLLAVGQEVNNLSREQLRVRRGAAHNELRIQGEGGEPIVEPTRPDLN